MYKRHHICRACGSETLIPVADFGLMPLANDFRKADEEHAGYAPLLVLFCERCTLAQLSVVVNPLILYANYPYVTSKSATMKQHFENLWRSVKAECNPERVIEIGSNDGEFLKFAKANGATRILGIDPAQNLVGAAIGDGITTVDGFFDNYSAHIANGMLPSPDLIMARHVFAHIDDWREFVRNLGTLASKDTLVVLEVPSVMNLLKHVQFDSIYSEHLSYVSVKAMEYLLKRTPFHLHKIVPFEIHGGSLAIMLRWNDSDYAVDASVAEFIGAENITLPTWELFSAKAKRNIDRLKWRLIEFRHDGKLVCGFGASAKSTVWINACGFTRKEIAFICDNTPQKQGKFSPGTDIPIVPESELAVADVAICFAWNFWDFILEKNKAWTDKGGHFVNPHSL